VNGSINQIKAPPHSIHCGHQQSPVPVAFQVQLQDLAKAALPAQGERGECLAPLFPAAHFHQFFHTPLQGKILVRRRISQGFLHPQGFGTQGLIPGYIFIF